MHNLQLKMQELRGLQGLDPDRYLLISLCQQNLAIFSGAQILDPLVTSDDTNLHVSSLHNFKSEYNKCA